MCTKMKKTLTIFTPTFNRQEKLIDLKESLENQTDKNFIWMIVNDGSTDNTEDIVRKFQEDSCLNIEYYYQDNHGKHVAHNFGVKMCKTELFFCVDSDDLLPPDAVEKIKLLWNKRDETNDISGIVGIKAYYDNSIVGNYFPDNIMYSKLNELYEIYGKQGDTALIWRTEVIKKYPFKVFENENFLRENTAYDLIDMGYCLLVTNEILYLCEYFPDGLSFNATKLEMKNPKGASYYRLLEARKAKKIYKKIGYYSAYMFYCKLSNDLDDAKKELGFFKYYIFLMLSFLTVIRYKMRGKL